MSAPRVSLVTCTRCRAGATAACGLAGSGEALIATAGDGAEGREAAAPQAEAEDPRRAGAEIEIRVFRVRGPRGGAGAVDAALAPFGRPDRPGANTGLTVAGARGDRPCPPAAERARTTAPPGRGVTTGSVAAGRVPGGRAFPATAAARITGLRVPAAGGLSPL
jgi:hypothetical protein